MSQLSDVFHLLFCYAIQVVGFFVVSRFVPIFGSGITGL